MAVAGPPAVVVADGRLRQTQIAVTMARPDQAPVPPRSLQSSVAVSLAAVGEGPLPPKSLSSSSVAVSLAAVGVAAAVSLAAVGVWPPPVPPPAVHAAEFLAAVAVGPSHTHAVADGWLVTTERPYQMPSQAQSAAKVLPAVALAWQLPSTGPWPSQAQSVAQVLVALAWELPPPGPLLTMPMMPWRAPAKLPSSTRQPTMDFGMVAAPCTETSWDISSPIPMGTVHGEPLCLGAFGTRCGRHPQISSTAHTCTIPGRVPTRICSDRPMQQEARE